MHISDTYCPILLPLHVPPILVLLLVDLLILLDLSTELSQSAMVTLKSQLEMHGNSVKCLHFGNCGGCMSKR